MTDLRLPTMYMSDGAKERIAGLLSDPEDFAVHFDSDGTDSWIDLDVYQTFTSLDGYSKDFRTYRFDFAQFNDFLNDNLTPAELAELIRSKRND